MWVFQETERRLARLESVLQRSAVFSSILKDRMDEEKARQAAIQAERREQLQRMPRAGDPRRKRRASMERPLLWKIRRAKMMNLQSSCNRHSSQGQN